MSIEFTDTTQKEQKSVTHGSYNLLAIFVGKLLIVLEDFFLSSA